VPPVIAAGFLGIEHFSPPWDVFFLPLFNLLVFFYNILFNDFALAIIVFTVLIRTVLAPLFVRQIRSQKEMQRMQPLIKEVQRKHKGNRQKISEETMALYKEHGVNPAAGCLPVVLQLPILWALYQALIRASNSVTLTADQVKSDAFAQLQATLPGINHIAGSATQFTAPINGSCSLPAFDGGPFTHFLPLNCQLIDPVKLSDGINTVVAWLAKPFTGVHLD
jgi:YidC/Oxa1 family membrane protein insertase